MDLRINRRIRAPKVRVIDQEGQQVGVVALDEALAMAQRSGLDLVEISPSAEPPVCKIIDYGKYRYDQTKKERENKKAQHQIKIKEIKLKPNIDDHDFDTKLKAARQFLEKGNKVKVSCFFRGREMTYPERGERVVTKMCEELADVGQLESPLKRMGRSMICVIAPGAAPKKKEGKQNAKDEDK